MTDFYYDDEDVGPYEAEPDATGSRRAAGRGLATAAGLVISLSMIAGMGVWGYELLVRDVEGIPVIQAMEGSFRTQPMDPGGMQAPNQGLEVNRVAAGMVEERSVDEVRLAPDPIGVSPDDAAGLAGSAPAEDAEVAPQAEADGIMASAADLLPEEGTGVVEDTPADVSATDFAVAEALRAAAGDSASGDLQVASYDVRPVPRPEEGGAAAIVGEAPAAAAASEVPPSSLSAGDRLAQLGAYDTPQIARENWDRIVGEHPEVFRGKSRVVQEAQANGGTFYRLRVAGFADDSESQQFCTALMSKATDCIPVAVR